MVSGYVLILAVLLLGGVIATLGDRIGMRVGKARLSLFNLRPRQTATLVSIVTGGVISASTLALLFGVSSQLRTGVFELGEIQEDLEAAEVALRQAQQTKDQIQAELVESVEEREQARKQLESINQSLRAANAQEQRTRSQLQRTRQQLASVSSQTQALNQEIEQLQAEQRTLEQRQADISVQITARDREIAQRDAEILQRQQQLTQLEDQKQFLEKEVADLERQFEGLFRGNIALGRNQELVSGLVRVNTSAQASQFIEQLLQEANRVAIRQIAPGTLVNRFVLATNSQELTRLVTQISDGQEYLVRVLSAANYISGEDCVVEAGTPCIQVFSYAVVNELIYQQGDRLATVDVPFPAFSDQQLVERLNYLISVAQFQARQDGVVDDTLDIAGNRPETVLAFLEAIKAYGNPLSIQAITTRPIYAVGPLSIDLFALDRDQIVFCAGDACNPQPPSEEAPPPDPSPERLSM